MERICFFRHLIVFVYLYCFLIISLFGRAFHLHILYKHLMHEVDGFTEPWPFSFNIILFGYNSSNGSNATAWIKEIVTKRRSPIDKRLIVTLIITFKDILIAFNMRCHMGFAWYQVEYLDQFTNLHYL